jgi:hypothetical protein
VRVLLDIEIIFKILHKDGNGLEESSVKSLTFWQTKKNNIYQSQASLNSVSRLGRAIRLMTPQTHPPLPETKPEVPDIVEVARRRWRRMSERNGSRSERANFALNWPEFRCGHYRVPVVDGGSRPDINILLAERSTQTDWYQYFIIQAFYTDILKQSY